MVIKKHLWTCMKRIVVLLHFVQLCPHHQRDKLFLGLNGACVFNGEDSSVYEIPEPVCPFLGAHKRLLNCNLWLSILNLIYLGILMNEYRTAIVCSCDILWKEICLNQIHKWRKCTSCVIGVNISCLGHRLNTVLSCRRTLK